MKGAKKVVELHAVDARFAGEAPEEDPAFGLGGARGGAQSAFGESGGNASGGSEFELFFSEEEIIPGAENDFPGREDAIAGGPVERHPPFHELYVDTNFEPISAEEVLKVVKGDALPETNLELLIAKRLPVRIGVKMDERKIPAFMAACINSPFSYEIQQVRINRHTPGGDLIGLGGGTVASSGRLQDDKTCEEL